MILQTVRRFGSRLREKAEPKAPVAPVPSPQPSLFLNEGKLILVGRGEVGKTSLVRRLTANEFHGDESKTQGIRITNWDLVAGAEQIRLNVWDFGGQEIMHATHQFFLTERSLYLLVLNGRNGGEDADAEYWLKHIQSFGGDSPVLVVQNKIGQHPFDLNYRGLQARYPQIRGFVKTDCEDATGIGELKSKIQTAIEAIPEIRISFQADWFKVKERIQSMAHEFMGYEDFKKLCAEEGITKEADLDTLSFVLHCLGIALNYRKDTRLRETSVLRPEWVTEGIYKILNAPKLACRQGELRLDDLMELLPADRYPHDKHLFLIELMRKFSLCFAFPDSTDRYLVPDLLGKEEPEQTAQFAPAECLNFEYQYEVLPEGLLPRFIVRSHILSRDQQRWRSGVILARDKSLALVTSLPAERRVVVRILGGDAASRRELLAIIRYDLDGINAEFKDALGAKAQVPLPNHPACSIDYEKLLALHRAKKKGCDEFVDGEIVSVDVEALLNGVDVEPARVGSPQVFTQAPMVFFSYCHKDETLRDELETHLKLLQRQQVVGTWHDRRILPGDEWDREIDRALEHAAIVLFLVSSDFLASDYCNDKEVARAMERHEAGEAKVIPVVLRPCDWKSAAFAKLQGLPKSAKPITKWSNRDDAWTDVAKGIRSAATKLMA